MRLSGAGEDGFNAVAGGDGSQWIAAWRNGATELVTVAMPREDLRVQSRRAIAAATPAVAFIGAVSPGTDPAIVWNDWTGVARLHVSFVRDGTDRVVAETSDLFAEIRVIDGEAFWIERGTTSRVAGTELSRHPSPSKERLCLTSLVTSFAVRGSVSAVLYVEGPRLHVQRFASSPASRQRAVHR